MKRVLPDAIIMGIQAPVVLLAIAVVGTLWLLDSCLYVKSQFDWDREFNAK